MPYTREENLIIQSTCNAVLLLTLCIEDGNFIKSEYFKTVKFPLPVIKEMYESGQIGIGSQGMLMVCLYALLVLPKELIQDECKEEYKKVNLWIESHCEDTITDTYPARRDYDDLKHIIHMRNAVSHGKVDFDDTDRNNVICVFYDNDRSRHNYQLKLTTVNVGNLVYELILAPKDYVERVAMRENTEN